MLTATGVTAQIAAWVLAFTKEAWVFLLLAKPGAYAFIGNGDGDHREHGHGLGPCNLHNASYDFNDQILPIGASYWVRLAEDFLA